MKKYILLLIFITTPAISEELTIYSYDTGEYKTYEIDRTSQTSFSTYDYNTGKYTDYEVTGRSGEIESYDYNTGEYQYYDVE